MDHRKRKPREIFDYYDGIPMSFAIRDDGGQLYYAHHIGKTDSGETKYAYRGCTTESLGPVLQKEKPVGEFLRNPDSGTLYEVTYKSNGTLHVQNREPSELESVLPDENVYL